jgi:hypothetical protein
MRQVRARIDDDDAGLSWQEKQRKTLTILEKDPLWAKLKDRVVEGATGVRTAR